MRDTNNKNASLNIEKFEVARFEILGGSDHTIVDEASSISCAENKFTYSLFKRKSFSGLLIF